MASAKKRLTLTLTEKDARIVKRALLKFTTTSGEDAPESNEEITALYFRVDNLMRGKGIAP